MADSTKAFFLFPVVGGAEGSAAFAPPSGVALAPEGAPAVMWGQGTPNGDLAPFSQVNKGSLYMAVNNTDDDSHVYMKVDEGGDNDDWVRVITGNMTIALDDTVGLNIAASNTEGGAASWNAGLFVSISEPATKAVSGYFCAAELELSSLCSTSSAMYVLVLNSNITAMGSDTYTAFIRFQDWGTEEMPYMLDLTTLDIGSNSTGCIFSTSTSDITATHAIRIVRAAVPYWILVSSAGPA